MFGSSQVSVPITMSGFKLSRMLYVQDIVCFVENFINDEVAELHPVNDCEIIWAKPDRIWLCHNKRYVKPIMYHLVCYQIHNDFLDMYWDYTYKETWHCSGGFILVIGNTTY
jgi:hypothetical protein